MVLKKGKSIFNKAIINEMQYNKFPKDIQNINFEEINSINNNFEIIKQNDDNYGVLMINLKEKNNEIEFLFRNKENDDESSNSGELSTLHIVLISVSGLIFILIVVLVIIIVIRKKRKSSDFETRDRIKSLQNELIQMSGSDEDKLKENKIK